MPYPEFATEAEIPEAFRPEYEKGEDGKFRAKVVAVPDVAGLTSALASERTKASDAEKARKAAEKERDEFKRSAEARAAGISEEELKKIRDAEELARKPIIDELNVAKAELRKIRFDDQIRRLGLENGWLPTEVERAMRDLKGQRDGKGRLELTDAGGLAVYDDAGNLTSETADQFLKTTYRKEAPGFYKGTGSSGSGATGSDTSGGTASNYDPEKAGKAMAAQQKVSGANNLAFK